MLCPLCKIYLDRAIFSGVEVNYCPCCLGLWFEKEELRLAKDVKDRKLRWLDIDLWREKEKFKISPGQKLCPWCRLPLYEVEYDHSSIRIDLCNICQGIWLDRGEFKKIIQYLKEKADYEILNHYLKNLSQEFWEIFLGPETLKEEVLDFLTVLKLFNYKFMIQHPQISRLIFLLPK